MGPLGITLSAARRRVDQSTWGRPKPIKRNRLMSRKATMQFWTRAVDLSPMMLTMVQRIRAAKATTVSLKLGKMATK